MTRRLLICWPFLLAALAVCAVSCADVIIVSPTAADPGDPVVLYTDITHGPNTGGEDNYGTYLSIFGRNLGTTQSTSTVEIGGVEVAAYKYWGTNTNGLTDIQQITVQPGGSVSTGAIEVIVGGVSSNTDHTFTVISGDLYFLDNTIADGGDGNGDGTVGDISDPFRYAQSTLNRSDFGAGDTLVLRGTGTDWTDDGNWGGLVGFGSTKQGTAGAPMMMLAYPGETVTLVQKSVTTYQSLGYIQISGLRFDNEDASKIAVNWNEGATHCRFVNLRAENMDGRAGGAGMFSINDSHAIILGCWIENAGSHDPSDSVAKLYHGIYFSNESHDCEVGWSYIEDVAGGRGIQCFESGSATNALNMRFHDTTILNTKRDALLFGNATKEGNKVYNCVLVHEDSSAALAMYDSADTEVDIYNNTLVVTSTGKAINFQDGATATMRNNIIVITGTGDYFTTDSTPSPTSSHNLWYGDGTPPTWDSDTVNSDPLFTNAGTGDYTLTSSSPAIDVGTPYITGTTPLDFGDRERTIDGDEDETATIDMGAFEYDPG